MVRRGAVLLVLAVFAVVLTTASATVAAPQAAAKANTLVVRIVPAQVELNPDGTVSIPVRARCSPPLDAFEVDVSVRQGGTFGSVSLIGTPFPACTGRWQRTTLTVSAEAGTFVPGPATVDAFLGAFDPVGGADLAAEDTAPVTL